MSERIGVTVLRKVAEHYRTHPGSWCTGSGTLYTAARKDVSIVRAELDMPGATGCMHTMIVCYAAMVGGESGKKLAEQDAMRILCEHLGKKDAFMSIHAFNDSRCGSQDTAIATLHAAVEKAELLPITESVRRRKSLVTASIVAMFAIGLLGSAFV